MLESWAGGRAIDILVQRAAGRAKRLLAADMDSTVIAVECIDELADYAGLKPEIAAITERAMKGELDFAAALAERMELLAGLDSALVDRCLEERVRHTPGARRLVATMKANGAYCLLLSGGFTAFAGPVADALGFDEAVANRLALADDRLTGKIEGRAIGAEAKRDAMLAAARRRGLGPADCLAVGDGANDVPMLEAAGLGIAYRAKPAASAAADGEIRHHDLAALLFVQGYARKDWSV